ncbi:hypothetical protein EV122DRAFT_224054 [Schizophyllum commune]
MPRRSVMSLGGSSSARGRTPNRPTPPTSERNSSGVHGESSLNHCLCIQAIPFLVFGSCMAAFFTLLGQHVLSYTSDSPSSVTVGTLGRVAALGGCIVIALLYPAHFVICDTLSKKGASNNQLFAVNIILAVLVDLPVLGAIAGPCGLVLWFAVFGLDSVLTVGMVGYMGAIGYGVSLIAIDFLVLCVSAILGLAMIEQNIMARL